MIIKASNIANLKTKFGNFKIKVFKDKSKKEHLVLIKGNIEKNLPLVRIHSECLTGDVFFSLRCDCRSQLENSIKKVEKNKCGIIIYLRQEGRGIGLLNKINAYNLQDKGKDTVEANLDLGFKEDQRNYDLACEILKDLKVLKIKLITNNPLKMKALKAAGIDVVERIKIDSNICSHNKDYLKTKQKKLGHFLNIS